MRKKIVTSTIMLASMVLLASAQITFAPAVNIPISGTFTEHLAKGDFDNNGTTDIVAVSGFYSSVNDYKLFVYLQDLTGHLSTTPVVYSYRPSYPAAGAVAAGDVNNDGLCDVVIGFGDSIGIFYQNSSGTLNNQVDFICNGTDVDAIKIVDVDGDGFKDIVTVSWSGEVLVFYSNSTGVLTRRVYPTAVGAGYDDLDVGKLGNDSLTSIVLTSWQNWVPAIQVRVRNNRSADTTIGYTLGVVDNISSVAIGDFYGTGKKQIAASFGGNAPLSHIAVWRHPNAITVADTIIDVTDIPEAIEAGKLDCSGKDKIVVIHPGFNQVSVIDMMTGIQTFFVMTHNNVYSDGLVLADVNGDGKNDIVTVNAFDGVTILINTTIIADTARLVPLPIWKADTLVVDTLPTFIKKDTAINSSGCIISTHYGCIVKYSIDTLYEQDTLWNIRNRCTDAIISSGTIFHFWHSNTNWSKTDTTYIVVHDTLISTLVNKETGKDFKFNVYPNPFTEKLTVETNGEFFVTFYNLTGQKITEQKGLNKEIINTENLSPGNYIVVIKIDKNIVTRKIIKN